MGDHIATSFWYAVSPDGRIYDGIACQYIDEPEYPISDCTAIEQVWDELFTKKNQEETTILSIPISDAFLYKEIL